MFHGLVAPAYLKTYCEQLTVNDYVIPDIMIYDHPTKQRNGAFVTKRRILEVKAMPVDSNLNIYNGGKPTKRQEKRELGYLQQVIIGDVRKWMTATGNESKPFTGSISDIRRRRG